MGAATWMAMAAGLVAIVGMGGFLRASRERDALRRSLQVAQAERGARLAAMDSLRTTLEDKDRMIANLTGAQVAVMTLASQSPTSPTGRMFWDQARDAWTFVAHRVPMPKSGRTYQTLARDADGEDQRGHLHAEAERRGDDARDVCAAEGLARRGGGDGRADGREPATDDGPLWRGVGVADGRAGVGLGVYARARTTALSR